MYLATKHSCGNHALLGAVVIGLMVEVTGCDIVSSCETELEEPA